MRYTDEKDQEPLLEDSVAHQKKRSPWRLLYLLPTILILGALCYFLQDQYSSWTEPPVAEIATSTFDSHALLQDLNKSSSQAWSDFEAPSSAVDFLATTEDAEETRSSSATSQSTSAVDQFYDVTTSALVEQDLQPSSVPTSTSTQVKAINTKLAKVKTLDPLEQLDLHTCGYSPCKFLLAARIGEGESKAHVHIAHIAMMAKTFNRTLVLPNIENGLMSTCAPNAFDFYFDTQWFSETFGVKVLLFSDFQAWVAQHTKLAKAQPTAQYILASNELSPTSEMRLTHAPPPMVNLKGLCYKEARLDYKQWSSVSFVAPHKYIGDMILARDLGGEVHDLISSDNFFPSTSMQAKQTEPDVIVSDWHFAVAIWPMPGTDSLNIADYRLQYNARWRTLAEDEASKLTPYIAVHWRMETVPAQNLMGCGQSLHSELAKLKIQHPEISQVFLLTDYPIESPDHPHSLTFSRVLTNTHHNAIHYFVDHFTKQTNGLQLTTLLQEIPDVPSSKGKGRVSLLDLDDGLIGVLDRAIAKRATYFLAGEPGKCGRHSSMTAQIVGARKTKMENGDEHIKNAVIQFLKPAH